VGSLVVLLLAAAVAGGDLHEIRERGVLRVLVVEGSPEFYAVRPGALAGLDRELLDGFARLHKLEIKTVEVPSWDELLPALQEGRGEVIAGGVTATDKRRQLIDFSVEVFPTRHVVLTRKPHRVVQSLQELRSERVGTIRGTSMAEVVTSVGIPAANVDDSFASGGLPAGLKGNRFTACVDGLEEALVAQRADPALQIGMFVGPRQSLAFGVRKDEPELRRALDEYLANVRRTPTWNRLVVKYFGASALDILKKAGEEPGDRP
jgi:ABC-type amino acid transport substrate-binding protein